MRVSGRAHFVQYSRRPGSNVPASRSPWVYYFSGVVFALAPTRPLPDHDFCIASSRMTCLSCQSSISVILQKVSMMTFTFTSLSTTYGNKSTHLAGKSQYQDTQYVSFLHILSSRTLTQKPRQTLTQRTDATIHTAGIIRSSSTSPLLRTKSQTSVRSHMTFVV